MPLQTRVVFVQGLPQNATEDTVLNYFENSRRSGGGAVEEVKIEGNVAQVQFESSEGNSTACVAGSFVCVRVTRSESARGLEGKTFVAFLFFSRPFSVFYHLRLSMYQSSLSFVDKEYIAEVVVASALVVTQEKIYNLRFQKY